MSKKYDTGLPGIDLKAPGFRAEKRERMTTKEQVSAYVDRATHTIAGEVKFAPGEFKELIQTVFDAAYSIGLREGNKLRDWNERMQ